MREDQHALASVFLGNVLQCGEGARARISTRLPARRHVVIFSAAIARPGLGELSLRRARVQALEATKRPLAQTFVHVHLDARQVL